MRADQEYLVALGGNLPSDSGEPAQTLAAALATFAAESLQLVDVSRFFDTPCFPAGAGPDYVNAAARLHSHLTPQQVLAALHRIEARFGRLRQQRWGMRTLDIDLVAAGQLVLPDDATHDHWRALAPAAQIGATPSQLILPHPRLQDRAFVLVPLAEIAPDWVHPVTGLSVTEMVGALAPQDRAAVKLRH